MLATEQLTLPMPETNTADHIFDKLATIAVDQGADPDEVACAYEEHPADQYWLAVNGDAFSMSAISLEEGMWPALMAAALAANANGLPKADLGLYARRYEGEPLGV